MSADPGLKGRWDVITGGIILKNLMYTPNPLGEGKVPISSAGTGPKVADQHTIPPYQATLSRHHPCWDANKALKRCNLELDAVMRLGARCAACNDERINLMKCFVRHKTNPIIQGKIK